jgi:hypothetical protein
MLMKNLSIYRGKQTVFTLPEISSLTNLYDGQKLYSALKYAIKSENLFRVSRGIYAFNNLYNRQEFANKYRSPSYVSLYTILQEAGIVFQPYTSIYAVSNRSEMVIIQEQKYIYRKIKDEFLLNPFGITLKDRVNKASPERALCDKIYLDGDEYFDNLRQIDWNFAKTINRTVYQNNSAIRAFIRRNKK